MWDEGGEDALEPRERERERNEQQTAQRKKKRTVMHIQNEGLHPCGLSS